MMWVFGVFLEGLFFSSTFLRGFFLPLKGKLSTMKQLTSWPFTTREVIALLREMKEKGIKVEGERRIEDDSNYSTVL